MDTYHILHGENITQKQQESSITAESTLPLTKHAVVTQRWSNYDHLQMISVRLAKHRMTEGPVSFLVASVTVYNGVTAFAFEHNLFLLRAKIAFLLCKFFAQDLSLVIEPLLPVLNHARTLRIRDVHLTF